MSGQQPGPSDPHSNAMDTSPDALPISTTALPVEEDVKNFPPPPQMIRGLSVWDPLATEQLREDIQSDVAAPEQSKLNTSTMTEDMLTLNNMPHRTLVWPNLSSYDFDIQDYVAKDLYQKDHIKNLTMKKSAEQPAIINWQPNVRSKLIPLRTEGDGNCLLHAVSLAMWGIHDRNLVLRKAVNATFEATSLSHPFCARWKAARGLGPEVPELIWTSQWQEMVNQTKAKTIKNVYGKLQFEFLEQLHVFVLAHMLKRPIILYADNTITNEHGKVVYTAEGAEQMSGLYLPLDLPPEECHKDPIGLSFYSSHFAALVAEDPFPLSTVLTELQADSGIDTKLSSSTTVTNFPLQTPQPEASTPFEIHDDFAAEPTTPTTTTTTTTSSNSMDTAEEEDGSVVVSYYPIIDARHKPLPIQMLYGDEKKQDPNTIIARYLDLTTLDGIRYATQTARARTKGVLSVFKKYLAASEVQVATLKAERLAEASVVKGPCSAGCGFLGRSDQAGMCSKCFKQHNAREIKRASARNARQSRIPPAIPNEPRQLCKGGCGFYGAQSSLFYCSKCYLALNIQAPITTSVSASSSSTTSITAVAADGLCVAGCGFCGSPATMNMCSQCYGKKKPALEEAQRFWTQAHSSIVQGPCIWGCDFFGSIPSKACSSCFKKYGAAPSSS